MKYDPNHPDFHQIPKAMQDVPRWVCWAADKTPINVHQATGARSNDPTTWATFVEACAFIGRSATYTNKQGQQTTAPCVGIGFMLGDGWTGIDLDGGSDHGGDEVPAEVLGDFMQLGTYCEYSKSGEGYHFIGRYHGDKLEGSRYGCVEIYHGGRYFAITGNVYKGSVNVGDITGKLPQLHDKYIAAPKREKEAATRATAAPSSVAMPSSDWDDYLKQNVNDMLRVLDPVAMDEWQFVGICLKSLGFSVDLFDDFSRGAGSKYGGRKQIDRWWNSWKALDPEAGKKLYGRAKAKGWNPPKEGMPQMKQYDEAFAQRIDEGMRQHKEAMNAPQIVDQGKTWEEVTGQTIRVADPGLEERLKQKPRMIMPTADDPDPDGVTKYIEGGIIADIQKFIGFKARKTGFKNLDDKCGSLYPGLYVLGAISSLGKTTFVHNIADNLAKAGDHVLYFSLEQTRLEMTLKSLARTSAQADPITWAQAASAIEMRRGEKRDVLLKSAEAYTAAVGNRMHVVECNFDITVADILKYIQAFMDTHTGINPVVIIDYLQVTNAEEDNRQEYDKIKKVAGMLKNFQKSHDLVMIVISSVNRGNYLLPIDFESFKGCGEIEYDADVVWGLQLQALSDKIFDDDKGKTKQKRDAIRVAKAAIPRAVELVCLKNRYGTSSYYAGFKYYPQYDYFEVDPKYVDPDHRISK